MYFYTDIGVLESFLHVTRNSLFTRIPLTCYKYSTAPRSVNGRTHGAAYHGHGYVPLRVEVGRGDVVMRMGHNN